MGNETYHKIAWQARNTGENTQSKTVTDLGRRDTEDFGRRGELNGKE
jgi:hypothetical protein